MRRSKKVLALVTLLALLAGVVLVASPPAALAGEKATSLTVEVLQDGTLTQTVTYSLEELAALPQIRQIYSGIDSMPAARLAVAEGVYLDHLFSRVGVNLDYASQFKFISTDGYETPLSKTELFDVPRYYYPQVVAGSEEGKVPVKPMLALKSYVGPRNVATPPSWESMDDANTLRLFLGQKSVTDVNNYLWAKWVCKVQVETTAPAAAPVLNPDTSDNLVGQPIEITFTDDPTWRAAVTEVTVNGSSVAGQYTLAPGVLTIEAGVFPAAGDYMVVVKAAGYADATVTQTLVAASSSVTLSLSPTVVRPGVSVTASGSAEANTYVPIKVVDEAGNIVVFDAVRSGADGRYSYTFTLPEFSGQRLTVVAGSGSQVATGVLTLSQGEPVLTRLTLSGSPELTYSGSPFTFDLSQLTLTGTDQNGAPFDLTGQAVTWTVLSGPATVEGSTLTITGAGTIEVRAAVAGVTSNPLALTVTGGGVGPPALIPDTTDNLVGRPVEITFTDDPAWRAAVTEVTVNGSSIAGRYTLAAGVLTIEAGVFPAAGNYTVVVKAAGYPDAAVTQPILGPGAAYAVTAEPSPHYQAGTVEGITTMTVKGGVGGLKYFTVNVSPVREHGGEETLVFAHLRQGVELGLSATRADFDRVGGAAAGFNVRAGDVVKAYVVDRLSNATDFNPIVFLP
jgi:hypothetical protein